MILHSPESTPGSWWFLSWSESWTERMQASTVLAERGRRVERRAWLQLESIPWCQARGWGQIRREASVHHTFAFTLNLNLWSSSLRVPRRGE